METGLEICWSTVDQFERFGFKHETKEFLIWPGTNVEVLCHQKSAGCQHTGCDGSKFWIPLHIYQATSGQPFCKGPSS